MTAEENGRSRSTAIGLTLGWLLALGLAVLVLHVLGHGDLSTPPFGSYGRLRDWLDRRDTATAAFALLRVTTLVVAWYLLGVTVIGLAARLVRRPTIMRLAEVTTVPVVHRLLGTLAGVGLSASTAALVATPFVTGQGRPPITSQANGDATSAGSGQAGHHSPPRLPNRDPAVVMERIARPHDDGQATMRVVEQPPAPPRPSATSPLPTRTVQPGDSFWHLAETALTEADRRPPTEAEILPYWHLLIEHNRHRLVDPANPDLIYVGQVFQLPPPAWVKAPRSHA